VSVVDAAVSQPVRACRRGASWLKPWVCRALPQVRGHLLGCVRIRKGSFPGPRHAQPATPVCCQAVPCDAVDCPVPVRSWPNCSRPRSLPQDQRWPGWPSPGRPPALTRPSPGPHPALAGRPLPGRPPALTRPWRADLSRGGRGDLRGG